MKLRTLASLFVVLVLASCSQPSSLSSGASSFSSSADVPSSSLPRDIENEYDGYYKDIATWSNGEELKNKLNVL